MIESMVDGLASKLEDDPQDFPGWTRLIRSYVVLGKPDDAMVAFNKARLVFSDQPQNLLQLEQQAQELGLAQTSTKGE